MFHVLSCLCLNVRVGNGTNVDSAKGGSVYPLAYTVFQVALRYNHTDSLQKMSILVYYFKRIEFQHRSILASSFRWLQNDDTKSVRCPLQICQTVTVTKYTNNFLLLPVPRHELLFQHRLIDDGPYACARSENGRHQKTLKAMAIARTNGF